MTWAHKAGTLRHDALPKHGVKTLLEHANNAERAINAYWKDNVPHGAARALSFLLVDLMHWADRMGVDFTSTFDAAQSKYRSEINDEPRE